MAKRVGGAVTPGQQSARGGKMNGKNIVYILNKIIILCSQKFLRY
jgi:hypothetical protein